MHTWSVSHRAFVKKILRLAEMNLSYLAHECCGKEKASKFLAAKLFWASNIYLPSLYTCILVHLYMFNSFTLGFGGKGGGWPLYHSVDFHINKMICSLVDVAFK